MKYLEKHTLCGSTVSWAFNFKFFINFTAYLLEVLCSACVIFRDFNIECKSVYTLSDEDFSWKIIQFSFSHSCYLFGVTNTHFFKSEKNPSVIVIAILFLVTEKLQQEMTPATVSMTPSHLNPVFKQMKGPSSLLIVSS